MAYSYPFNCLQCGRQTMTAAGWVFDEDRDDWVCPECKTLRDVFGYYLDEREG